MSDLHFDQHQFEGRRHPVSAEFTLSGWTSNGVAFEDYTRMETRKSSVPRRCKRWTPTFAASPEKLRRVLLQRAWTYLHPNQLLPAAAEWKTINAAATKRAVEELPVFYKNLPEKKRRDYEVHAASIKRAGGYLELQAAIAYRAWMLGQDSVAIGDSLGITPQCARQNLVRICKAARRLGYETFPRHHSYKGQSRCRTRGKMSKILGSQTNSAFALHSSHPNAGNDA